MTFKFDIWEEDILLLLILLRLLIEEFIWFIWLIEGFSWLLCDEDNIFELFIFIFGIILVVKFCLDIWALDKGI